MKKTETGSNRLRLSNREPTSAIRKGKILKKNLIAKAGVAASVACALVAGAVIPAHADPESVASYATLAGFGSDTTMDVMDAVAIEVNAAVKLATPGAGDLLSSYKAVGGKDVYSKLNGLAARSNGSSAGRDHLLVAIGHTGSKSVAVSSTDLGVARSTTVTTESQAGLIDYARSSSGPSGSSLATNGVITYIPFASDSMTYATAPNSLIPNGIPLGGSNTTELSLTNIYKGNLDAVEVDSNGDYVSIVKTADYTGSNTLHPINAYIPQAGSGTRSYWIGKVGITEANITAGTTKAKDRTPGGVSVQEHDGTALVNDRYALAAFSISQWVAQTNGASVSRLNGAVLKSIDVAISPTTGSGTSYATNPAWPSTLKRTVYNIVPSADADNASSAIYKAFVGTDSLVCKATAAITRLGFGLLATPAAGADATAALTGDLTGSGATTCGSRVTANRMYAPTATTVTLGTPVVTGNVVKVEATVVSNGNQGGTVTLYENFGLSNESVVATGVVAKGASTVMLTYTNNGATAATKAVTAEFLPTLSGLAASTATGTLIAAGKAAVTGALTYTSGTVASVKAKDQKLKVTIKYGTEALALGAPGSVTAVVKVGTKTISTTTGALVNGVVTLNLKKFTTKGTRTITITYTDTANGNATTVATQSFVVR